MLIGTANAADSTANTKIRFMGLKLLRQMCGCWCGITVRRPVAGCFRAQKNPPAAEPATGGCDHVRGSLESVLRGLWFLVSLSRSLRKTPVSRSWLDFFRSDLVSRLS